MKIFNFVLELIKFILALFISIVGFAVLIMGIGFTISIAVHLIQFGYNLAQWMF